MSTRLAGSRLPAREASAALAALITLLGFVRPAAVAGASLSLIAGLLAIAIRRLLLAPSLLRGAITALPVLLIRLHIPGTTFGARETLLLAIVLPRLATRVRIVAVTLGLRVVLLVLVLSHRALLS